MSLPLTQASVKHQIDENRRITLSSHGGRVGNRTDAPLVSSRKHARRGNGPRWRHAMNPDPRSIGRIKSILPDCRPEHSHETAAKQRPTASGDSVIGTRLGIGSFEREASTAYLTSSTGWSTRITERVKSKPANERYIRHRIA